LTNYGTVNWVNTRLFGVISSNAQIYNYGVWNAQVTTPSLAVTMAARRCLTTLDVPQVGWNGGATTLDGNVVFNNTGTVDVESGS